MHVIRTLSWLGTLSVLAACGDAPPAPTPAPAVEAAPPPAAATETPLGITWEDLVFSDPGCEPDGAPCARVSVRRAVIPDGPEPWRVAARAWMDGQLLMTHDGAIAPDLQGVADALFRGFGLWRTEHAMSLKTWSIERRVEIVAATDHVVSFRVKRFLYAGEGEGTTVVDLASFALSDGRMLTLADLVSDPKAITPHAEAAFRATWSLPAGRRLSAAGFNFPNGKFTLGDAPDLAVSADALHVQWDAGEVGEPVLGATEIQIPRVDLGAAVRSDAPW